MDESVCKIYGATNLILDSKETKKIRLCITGVPITTNLPPNKEGDQSTKVFLNDVSGNNTENSMDLLQYGEDIEFQFKISYVGDKASTNQNYYREVVKKLNVTTMPSAIVTKWDVLPSESSDKNFLVLDITNYSQNEMELMYADSKTLMIEPSDVCRIPLPIDR